ncbi:MAG: CPBP family intramembrane metalloprotease [Bacteroidales bacterium]|nr:CPBP family intramembrane metalloprotease [Bacteroidales bacterium]
MSSLAFIKRYPVATCSALIFVISWGLILLFAGPGNVPIDAERSENLLPLLYMMMLIGPGVAGLLLTGLISGKDDFLKLRKQLFKWRLGIHWYLTALLATPVLALVLLFVLSRFSSDFNIGIFNNRSENTSLVLAGIFTGLIVGLFEEISWSGFIVPNLRMRYDIVITGLIVGLIWGAWHFILFWTKDSFSQTLPLFILLGQLFVWLPPFRIFMVWILDRTGSLLMVILTHASLVFTTTVLVPMSLTGKNLLTWLIVWGAALWIILTAIAVFNNRKSSKNHVRYETTNE